MSSAAGPGPVGIRRWLVWPGLLLLQTVVWRLPFLGRRLSSDPSIFAYISTQVLDGAVPYRDLFDNKAPLIYYAGALFIRLADDVSLGYWLMEAFFVAFTAVVVFALARRRLAPLPAFWIASLFILLSNVSIFYYFTPGFVEYPAAAFTALAYLLTMQSRRTAAIGAGCAAALAFMSHQISLIACLPIGLALLLQRRWRDALGMALGFLAVCATLLGWFHARGALDDLLYANYRFNLFYVHDNPREFLAFRIPSLLILAAPIAFVFALLPWVVRADHESRLLQMWLLACVLALVPTGLRLYAHYYVILAAPLSLTLAYAWSAAAASGWSRTRRRAMSAAFLAVLLGLGLVSSRQYLQRTRERLAVADVGDFENPYRELSAFLARYPFPQERRVVLPLGLHTPSEIAVLANVRFPGRYTHSYCMFGVAHPQRTAMAEQWVAAIKADPPALVVQHASASAQRELQGDLATWISRNYAPATSIGQFVIHTRRY